MSEQKPPPKRGRPPKFVGSEERVSRSLRLMPDIEARVRSSAEINHRSIAEELEYIVSQAVTGISIFLSEEDRKEIDQSAADRGISLQAEICRRSILYAKEAHFLELMRTDFANFIERHHEISGIEEEIEFCDRVININNSRISEANRIILYLSGEIENIKYDLERLRIDIASSKSENEKIAIDDTIKSRLIAMRHFETQRSSQVSQLSEASNELKRAQDSLSNLVERRATLQNA